jgi:hypothetical protein
MRDFVLLNAQGRGLDRGQSSLRTVIPVEGSAAVDPPSSSF